MNLRGPCGAVGLRDLRADGTRGRQVMDVARPVVVGHLAASLRVRGVSVGLRDERLDWEAAPDCRTGLAVRRQDPIPFIEGHRAPHLARLVPAARPGDADAPL